MVKTDENSFKKLMILLATTQLLLIIDTSIINVIVPAISIELKFTETAQSWIANAYLTIFGGALLLSGRIADLVGKEKIFKNGLLVLAIGSLLAALTSNTNMFILGRGLQGLGSALSAAASLALIFSTFEGTQRGKALGLMAAMGGLGGALGTFLGGVFTEFLGWRSTFWISVIIPVVLYIYSSNVFSKLQIKNNIVKGIDIIGALLLIIGQSLLAYAIIDIDNIGLNPYRVISEFALSTILLIMFFIRQKKGKNPLIPFKIWNNQQLVAILIFSCLGQFIIFPMFFIGNLLLQNIMDYSPLQSGAAFLPLCVIVIITAANTSKWIRLGEMRALSLGFSLVALGMFWLGLVNPNSPFYAAILFPTLLIGIGLPIIAITTNILGGKHVQTNEEGLTSGLLTTFQQFGSIIGLAVSLSLAGFLTSYVQIAQNYIFADALLLGYKTAFMLGAIIAAISAWCCRLYRTSNKN